MGIGVTSGRLFRAGLLAVALLRPGVTVSAQSSGRFDLSGSWKTRFGPIEIIQRGDSVAGTFHWKESGEFGGRVEGVWLTGRWKSANGGQTGSWRLEVMPGANRLVGKSTPDDGGEIVNFSAVRAELLTSRRSNDIAPGEADRSDGGVSGSWEASLGDFTLRQEGELLTGLFDWDGGGRITGRRDGDQLRGEWYGRDGISPGRWHARLGEQGRALEGTWIGSGGSVQFWTAQRLGGSAEAGIHQGPSATEQRLESAFSGQWRSRFGNFRLAEALQIVAGRYEWDGGGTLTGTVVGDTASGKWLSMDGSKSGTWSLQSLPGGRILQGSLSATKPEKSSENWTAVRME